MLWLCALPIRITLLSGSSSLMTLEEMAETKEEERVLPACDVQANKAPEELVEASVEQLRR